MSGQAGAFVVSGTGGRIQREGVSDIVMAGAKWRIVPKGDSVSMVKSMTSVSDESGIPLASSDVPNLPSRFNQCAVCTNDTLTSQLPPSVARRRNASIAPNAPR